MIYYPCYKYFVAGVIFSKCATISMLITYISYSVSQHQKLADIPHFTGVYPHLLSLIIAANF
jgi:hypothetical protein